MPCCLPSLRSAAASCRRRGTFAFLLAALAPVRDAAAADGPCPREPALRPLLAGTIGGEVPAGLASMLRQAGSTPWLLGLEIPCAEQERVDAFLRTEGGAPARAVLANHRFWAHELQHGRRGAALLQLIDIVRVLRRRSPGLRIVCLGDPAATSPDLDGEACGTGAPCCIAADGAPRRASDAVAGEAVEPA